MWMKSSGKVSMSFDGHVMNRISDVQHFVFVESFGKSRGSKHKEHWNANSGGVLDP